MMMLPWWAQLIIGLVAELALVLVGSYVALGRAAFRNKLSPSVASGLLGFLLAPVFAGISGIVGLSGITSALLLLMWVMLFRGLLKLEWANSLGLGLTCVVLTYALVEWCGFGALLTPWWQMFI